jgi:DNA-binding transcriptional MocR family regulator
MAETVKPYRRIADTVVEVIEAGQYKRGDRLPTERELAESFRVSRHRQSRDHRHDRERLGKAQPLAPGPYILARARGLGLEPHSPEPRPAMRDHLERVIEHRLSATETEADQKARPETSARRAAIAKRVVI